jgi:hypothetical protein
MTCKSIRRALSILPTCALLCACASTKPVNIGGDTYYSSATNTAGIFGEASAVAGDLMKDGNRLCASKGRQFELVTQEVTPTVTGAQMGGASITFRCAAKSKNPVMRPDNGVSTVEVR